MPIPERPRAALPHADRPKPASREWRCAPTLCAYHAGRLRATIPAVDPEVLAAELLDDINSFTTADEVKLSPAATPSPWPTSPNSSSPAKPPWLEKEQPRRKPWKKGNMIASSPVFAKPAATLLHSAIRNRPAPPRSTSRMTRSAQPRTAAERRIAAPVGAGLWRLASSPTPWGRSGSCRTGPCQNFAYRYGQCAVPIGKMAT